MYAYARHLSGLPTLTVTVVLFSPGLLFDRLREAGIDTYLIKSRFKYDLLLVKRLARLFTEKRIDIVHTHGYKASILGGLAARWVGSKAVKTEHGLLEPSQRTWESLKMKLNLAVDTSLSALCFDHIVFVSQGVKDAKSYLRRRQATSLIYNGIPKFELDPKVKLSRKTQSAFHVGTVGRLTEVKGHRFLLEAMGLLRGMDVHLFVFGEGPLERELTEYVSENDLTEFVTFLGFVPNVHDYLPSLDAAVLPSLQEGFPYVMLECASVGVPVIASAVGGIKEVFEDGVDCLYVPPADSSALAGAIMSLHRDPELRRRLATAAQEKVNARFTIDKMAERYLRVYADLTSERGLSS